MKVVIILEDTPKGIYPEIRWRGNGCCDNPMDSISLHIATTVAKQIEESAKAHALRVDCASPSSVTEA